MLSRCWPESGRRGSRQPSYKISKSLLVICNYVKTREHVIRLDLLRALTAVPVHAAECCGGKAPVILKSLNWMVLADLKPAHSRLQQVVVIA